MYVNTHLPDSGIEKIVNRIFATRCITRADQQMFMSALLSKDSLSATDRRHIDRVFDGLRQGLLKVVD